MKRDELLWKIKDDEVCEYFRAYPALIAIVELHNPQDITLPDGDWGTNCTMCDGYCYPCPTIQAIEKELG